MCCKFNRKDTFSHDAYGLQELSIVVLTQLIALQLQFKMEFKFSHDHFASIFLCTYNYNHCGTQFFVSLSLWNVFFLIIYFVIRRSVKFQHAVNRSGRFISVQAINVQIVLYWVMHDQQWKDRQKLPELEQSGYRSEHSQVISLLLCFSKRAMTQCRSVEHYSFW